MTHWAPKDTSMFASYPYARYAIYVRFQQAQKPATLSFEEIKLYSRSKHGFYR